VFYHSNGFLLVPQFLLWANMPQYKQTIKCVNMYE
jgi:hypothetical protein